MTKKATHIAIHLAIYRLSVVVFFGTSIDEMIKLGIKRGIDKDFFTEEWKKDCEETMDRATGICVNYGYENNDVLVWLKERPIKLVQYATLTHELYHAVDNVAQSRSFECHENQEPKAYLFEYLFNEVCHILWARK